MFVLSLKNVKPSCNKFGVNSNYLANSQVVRNSDTTEQKKEKILELQKQLIEVNSQYQSAMENYENSKKIAARDILKANDFGIEKLVKKLVTFSDTLDICLNNKPDFESDKHKNNIHAKAAFDGIETTKSMFLSSMNEYNIREFKPALGDVFNPMIHNAIFEVDSDFPPKTIGVLLKAGWLHGEQQLIRPAAVGVVRS